MQTKLLFVSLQYAPARWHLRDKMAEVNATVAKFCAADPRRGFVDTSPSMLAPHGAPDESLYADDRLPMAAGGYAASTRLLAPLLH